MRRSLAFALAMALAAGVLIASAVSPTLTAASSLQGRAGQAGQAGRAGQARRVRPARFTVVEASIADLQRAMATGRVTSRQIVSAYLTRIAFFEDRLNAAITVNSRALEEADARDRERAAGRVRGPLHGIPIALKDNIQTIGLRTTGGALAFQDLVPPYDATLTANLRAAGAIVIAKTGMTELANWVGVAMPGNYNAVAGYGMNPYDPRRDPRPGFSDGRPVLSPGGSSSGIGTAANLWAANVGTETSGSILTPATLTMLVGVKPTVGRISRHGVIPITADQDTPGPMTKTVADAAVLMGALEGATPDPNDAATRTCTPPARHDYSKFLNTAGLRGKRIGVPRAFFYEPAVVASSASRGAVGPPVSPTAGSTQPRGGLGPAQAARMADAIAALRSAGAIVVDPANVPSIIDPDPASSFVAWGICAGPTQRRGTNENCSIVLEYGMKRDFNRWLASLGPLAPVNSLTELIAWNETHKGAGAIKYGQAVLESSDEMDLERDRGRYEADRLKDIRLAATHGIDEVLARENLDALLFPGASGAALAAKAGYPSIAVPFGFVPAGGGPNRAPFPAGFVPEPQPFGVTFTGTACSEPTLFEIAYAFEQQTRARVPPPGF